MMNENEFTNKFHGVTAKPRSVLMLLLEGKTDEEIAQTVEASTATVRKHVQNLCDRFEIDREINGIKRNRREDLIALFTQYKPELIGQRTASNNNTSVVAAYKQLQGETPKSRDLGEAPDVSGFYGRTEELAILKQWIVGASGDRCRLVAVFGMGGIGKTALSVKLTREIQGEFEYVIWRSLRKAPLLIHLLDELIQFLSGGQKFDLPKDDDLKISRLIECLQQNRCLLVLDGLEKILGSGVLAGSYQDLYKNYGDFLREVGEKKHQSCLLLTSLEKPREIAFMEGETSPVRAYALKGLKEEEARHILQEKGLSGQNQWARLIQFYRGNPLALKMIASTIKELLQGDVVEFFKQNLSWLPLDFEIFVEQQFERLSPTEIQVINQLSIEDAPVSIAWLHSCLQMSLPISFNDIQNAVQSLMRRSLIEINKEGITLQRVVMEYINKRLVNEIIKEISEIDETKQIEGIKLLKIHKLMNIQKRSDAESENSPLTESIRKRIGKDFIDRNVFVEQLNEILPLFKGKTAREIGYAEQNIKYLIGEIQP